MSSDRSESHPCSELQAATRTARATTLTSVVLGVALFVLGVSTAEIQLAQKAAAMRVVPQTERHVRAEPLKMEPQWTVMTIDESAWTIDVMPEPEVKATKPLVVQAPPKPQPKPKPTPKPTPKPEAKAKPKAPPKIEPKPIPAPPVADPAPVSVVQSAGSATAAPAMDGSVEAKGIEMAVINELVALVERYKHYPKRARDAGLEGVVTLLVEVDAEGRVVATELAKGGNALFRRATRAAAKHLSGYQTQAERAFRLEIPVRYRLN